MASYKVPQDVEADDKLLGPFTFRQFIYLLVVVGCIAIAWGLAQLFVGLAIIPLPAILLFGALALPLKKDQPMEIYLAAIISFQLKPRMRKWDPDGVESNITISAPKVIEVQRTKSLSGTEAEQRLGYLADIVDTQGWAIRGLDGSNTSMNNDMYLEARSATDILDRNTSIAQNFDHMMAQSTERMREEARQRMFQPAPPTPAIAVPVQAPIQPQPQYQQPPQQPTISPVYTQPIPQPQVQAAFAQPAPQAAPDPAVIPHFDPYPEFHQSIIQPLNPADQTDDIAPATLPTPAPAPAPAQSEETLSTTSDNDLKAGIINLASNTELSIETIQHQADRLKKKADKKKKDDGEVVISLR